MFQLIHVFLLSPLMEKRESRITIESQPKLKEMFKEPPIISYKRGISLRDILVRAKL